MLKPHGSNTRLMTLTLVGAVALVIVAASTAFAGFTDINASLIGVDSGSAAWGDYDNDGDLDLAIAGHGPCSKIYRNNNGTFMDSGVELPPFEYCAWGDYDNDGDLDLAVSGPGDCYSCSNTRIYRNDGGALSDSGVSLDDEWQSPPVWGDLDNDGDLDLTAGRKLYRNDGVTFTDLGVSLPVPTGTPVAWADYDNDGDLDLVVAGYESRIYRNDAGVLSDSGAVLPRMDHCTVAWGDYDNDGDLDLALAGTVNWGSPYSYLACTIYRNDGGSFVDSGASLPGVSDCSLAWGDYDNDGDLDLAIAGATTDFPPANPIARIYRNDEGEFVDSGDELPGVLNCSLAWGDYDNDGDLDLVLSGKSNTGELIAGVYRNDGSMSNTAPSAPTGLTVAFTPHGLVLSWNAAADAQTPALGLSYNIRVGTSPGACDVFGGMAAASDGWRMIPALGNAQKRLSWTVGELESSGTYYWSVQAIDAAFAGSPWAAEQQVQVSLVRITGHIRTPNGAGLSGVRVHADNVGGTAWTDSTGHYDLGVPEGWSGTVTPTKPDYWFTPTSRSYDNLTSVQGNQDYLAGTFTDSGSSLIGVSNCSLAWGDYDNDGDLDLALAGENSDRSCATRIYRNDGGGFVDSGTTLPDVWGASLAWGDYDNDGDLDLALSGHSRTIPYYLSRIYRNNGGTFTDSGASLIGVERGSVAWGDYDNDGDLDLAVSGYYYDNGSRVTTRIYRNDSGVFSNSGIPLINLGFSCLVWGDYDNDGDLDLALSGSYAVDYWTYYVSRIYRNDGGNFVDSGISLPGVDDASLAWGDFDNDGDLDLVIGGWCLQGRVGKIYRNDGGAFVDVGVSLDDFSWPTFAWGDYDNDGDLDLAAVGYTGMAFTGSIYRNDGGVFVKSNVTLDGAESLAWGDYDNDGDLDFAMAGKTDAATWITRVYRNDGGIFNTLPSAPIGSSATITGNATTFSWDASTDVQTPPNGLSYNLRVGTTPGDDDVFCGMANLSTGFRLLPDMGNSQKRLSWKIKGLNPSVQRYYWSAQAVDTSLAGSPWSTEWIATVDTVPPTINLVTVAPAVCAAGDQLLVTVSATDNVMLTSVTAAGVSLVHTGGSTWAGTITAASGLGTHVVTVVARDSMGNSATDAGQSYKNERVVAANNLGVTRATTAMAANYLFLTWGCVTWIDADTFELNDGSGFPITVTAPGHGLQTSDYACARGVWEIGVTPHTLDCSAAHVAKLK